MFRFGEPASPGPISGFKERVTTLRDDWERLAQITRLYLVVHGRPPDPAGLCAFLQHMRDGMSLRQAAAAFVNSDEFLSRLRDEDASAVLCRNAFFEGGEMSSSAGDGSLAELVEFLVLSPEVQQRLPVLPTLYPHGVPLDNPADYRVWLLSKQNEQALRVRPAPDAAGEVPAVSFIIILNRPIIPWLKGAIESVLAQPPVYAELLVAAPGKLPRFVRRMAEHDARLRLVQGTPWNGKAALFNRALAHCNAPFASLVGQHDQLDPTAATELTAALGAADIVLSDDDALDEAGLRHSPRLGTAWDADRVVAAGGVGLVVLRTAALRQVGGMRSAGGREEWDLLLRVAATVPAIRIVHVPSVVVSRRGAAVAHGPHRVYRRSARCFLDVTGHRGCAIRSGQGVLRVVYPLPRTLPLASIIIPTRDHADLMRVCTEGLLERTAYPQRELVIVDNGSVEPDAVALLQRLAQNPRVRVLSAPGPFNWSALNNAGVGQMRGEVAVLLNNDIEIIDPLWLHELVRLAMRPEVGAVGAKLLYRDRTIQHAGIVLGPAGHATHMWRHTPEDARGYLDQLIVTRQVTAITGACLTVRREVYRMAGGCEQDNLPITWNDVDLCLRIRALGLHVLWTPHARLLHLEQATRGSDETPERQARYQRERVWMRARWNGALDADAFLSPSLRPSEDPNETRPRLVTT